MAHSGKMTQTGGSIGFSLAASETNQGWAERRVRDRKCKAQAAHKYLEIIREKITT